MPSSTPKRFAEGTEVSVEKSRIEIEKLLAKHGASQRSFATDDLAGRTVLTFHMAGRHARLDLQVDMAGIPQVGQYGHPKAPQGWRSWSSKRQAEWRSGRVEQCNRELMRRMLLVLRGKLELIQDGVTTFEREFLADLLLPNGETIHQAIRGRLATAYQTGEMPLLLPPAGGGS